MIFVDLMRLALVELSTRRPVFHSESDFQHELAVQIKMLDPLMQIRLEKPIRLPDVKTINLDMFLQKREERYAIELKYITARLNVDVVDEEFALKSQSAQDLRRYDILSDIARIEQLVQAGVVDGGMSITITNDRSLWQESRKLAPIDEAFRIHEGRIVNGDLGWASHAAAGTIRKREANLILRGVYALTWIKYSELDTARNGVFRALIAEIQN